MNVEVNFSSEGQKIRRCFFPQGQKLIFAVGKKKFINKNKTLHR